MAIPILLLIVLLLFLVPVCRNPRLLLKLWITSILEFDQANHIYRIKYGWHLICNYTQIILGWFTGIYMYLFHTQIDFGVFLSTKLSLDNAALLTTIFYLSSIYTVHNLDVLLYI